jgi:hypothetical protein
VTRTGPDVFVPSGHCPRASELHKGFLESLGEGSQGLRAPFSFGPPANLTNPAVIAPCSRRREEHPRLRRRLLITGPSRLDRRQAWPRRCADPKLRHHGRPRRNTLTLSIVANPEHDLPVSSATGPRPFPVSPSFGRIIPVANVEAAKNGTDAFPPS